MSLAVREVFLYTGPKVAMRASYRVVLRAVLDESNALRDLANRLIILLSRAACRGAEGVRFGSTARGKFLRNLRADRPDGGEAEPDARPCPLEVAARESTPPQPA